MFIIPVGDRVNWKRPPVVTLLLILANCFVFFFLQAGGSQDDEKALQYYFSSGLPKWELPRYATYLENTGDVEEARHTIAAIETRNEFAVMAMENDTEFMRELHAGKVITVRDAEFTTWSRQRHEYESRKSFTSRHVYRVSEPDMRNALVSAFMHAGLDHLFGNMVVLFIVGFLVESVIGKTLFALMYVVSAYAAIYMFSLTAPNGSLLGASGAIAGVMGIYAVVFGLKKIDFFYSLAFYFDYVRAPAIALLPLWLGNELYQFLSEDGAHVAYMAHFGGLLGGAVMGGLYRWQRPTLIKGHHEKMEVKEMDDKEFQRGMDHLGAMQFKKALSVFKTLQEKHPDDTNLTRLIYRAVKSDPSSEDYHRAALTLLAAPEKDAATTAQMRTVLQEYLSCAKPCPKLGKRLIAALAMRFAGTSHCEEAEKLMSLLQRMAPQHNELPGVLLAVGRGYYREQRHDKFEAILLTLIRQFPQSEEANAATEMMRVVSR